jgi:hypothetical protein
MVTCSGGISLPTAANPCRDNAFSTALGEKVQAAKVEEPIEDVVALKPTVESK